MIAKRDQHFMIASSGSALLQTSGKGGFSPDSEWRLLAELCLSEKCPSRGGVSPRMKYAST